MTWFGQQASSVRLASLGCDEVVAKKWLRFVTRDLKSSIITISLVLIICIPETLYCYSLKSREMIERESQGTLN
jgi:hypothetical protein